ncbi:hypothetical protein KBC54_03000 [Patescibacteria group bacterium]|nr:hypothetical protein [Patescibacteria group bacterium]
MNMKKSGFVVVCMCLFFFVSEGASAAETSFYAMINGTNDKISINFAPPGSGGFYISEPKSALRAFEYFVNQQKDSPAKIQDGVLIKTGGESSSAENVIDFQKDLLFLGMKDGKAIYTMATSSTTTFYFDGSMGSWRFLQRKVFGPMYKDAFADADYALTGLKPKVVLKDCKDSQSCFEKAVLACKPAVFREKKVPAENPLTNQWEVWGKDKKGRCVTYRKVLGPTTAPKDFLDLFISSVANKEMVCVQKQKEVVAILKSPQKDVIKLSYASGELNPYANCRGTLAVAGGMKKSDQIILPIFKK